ncbi:MAG: F0F1 ATP synthase subunit B [Actinobacteria bacterium]|nr:F0F1 ATP synthase subunit B [Actinomycetota bacterium]
MSVLAIAIRASSEGDSPSVLGTPLDELILGTVAFLIVLIILGYLALPSIRKALAERTETIEGGIQKAEDMQAQAKKMMADYKEQIAGAQDEAAGIRAKAESDGKAIVESAKSQAEEERAAIAQRGAAQLEAEKSQTLASLRQDVGGLAVELAGKIVGESLTDDDRARAVVDRFISDLEAQAAAKGGAEA